MAGSAVRELLVVLALAVGGLTLAVLAVFGPWYGRPAHRARVVVIESPSSPDRAVVAPGVAAVGDEPGPHGACPGVPTLGSGSWLLAH